MLILFTLTASAPIWKAAADAIGAGSTQDDALANSPSKLHAHSIPFAASSAQANVNSYYCQTASGAPASPHFTCVTLLVLSLTHYNNTHGNKMPAGCTSNLPRICLA